MSLLPMISKNETLEQYRARWKLVNDVMINEDRRVSMGKRYRRFLSMIELTVRNGWKTSSPEEDAEAARRWRKIRESGRG